MLRRCSGAIDPICKPDARKTRRVIAIKAMGGNFNGEVIRVIEDRWSDLKVFRMTQAVYVFIAETGHFAAIEMLHFDGEKDEVVAKARDGPFCLKIARVDQEFNTISPSEIGFFGVLKRNSRDAVKSELFLIPPRVKISKSFFT